MAESMNNTDAKNLKQPVGAVMVVGGGIGGMQASLDLAESGFYVYLVDTSPTIGGVMAQLDKTFPTNDCAMCIMSPKLVESGRHLNIRIITNSEIEGVEGGPGRFGVTLIRKPRYIHPDRCTGCGECAKHCPVSAIDTYNEGLSKRAAIYIKYPQAIPKVFLIDRDQCIGCGLCERVCLAKAVNYIDNQVREKIEVGSIILSPGYEVFDARLRPEFGYGVYPNVVTSIEFERLLSATGPHRGHLLRPSDGTIPERVAFIQCVGSRDVTCGNEYCSSICCMYATKEAIIAKEHVHFVKPTIFYMDVRAHGKGFDAYYERAKAEHGLRYIKCMVSKVREKYKTKNLLLTYLDEEGKAVEEEFEMVVLSVGMVPSRETVEMAKRMGIELDAYAVDLEKEPFIRPEHYDVIICFRYLQRSLIPDMKKGLKAGGVVVYETYTIDQIQFGKPKNPDFLLKPNELLNMFRDFHCIKYHEGVFEDKKATAGIISKKP